MNRLPTGEKLPEFADNTLILVHLMVLLLSAFPGVKKRNRIPDRSSRQQTRSKSFVFDITSKSLILVLK